MRKHPNTWQPDSTQTAVLRSHVLAKPQPNDYAGHPNIVSSSTSDKVVDQLEDTVNELGDEDARTLGHRSEGALEIGLTCTIEALRSEKPGLVHGASKTLCAALYTSLNTVYTCRNSRGPQIRRFQVWALEPWFLPTRKQVGVTEGKPERSEHAPLIPIATARFLSHPQNPPDTFRLRETQDPQGSSPPDSVVASSHFKRLPRCVHRHVSFHESALDPVVAA